MEELEIENEYLMQQVMRYSSLHREVKERKSKPQSPQKYVINVEKHLDPKEEVAAPPISHQHPVEAGEAGALFKKEDTMESFGEISKIDNENDERLSSPDQDNPEIAAASFLDEKNKDLLLPELQRTPTPPPTKAMIASELLKKPREPLDPNDDSVARADSLMTNDISTSQAGRAPRQGVFLLEEFFLLGIGSHHRKALSNHLSNSVVKFQIGGIYHHPGKRCAVLTQVPLLPPEPPRPERSVRRKHDRHEPHPTHQRVHREVAPPHQALPRRAAGVGALLLPRGRARTDV